MYQGLTLTVGSNPTKFQPSCDKYLKSYSALHIINAGNINIKDMAPGLFLHIICGVLATF